MKKKKTILKTSGGVISTLAVIGAMSAAAINCSINPTEAIYAIDKQEYSTEGSFEWSATKTIKDNVETKTGTYTLNSDADNRTSIDVEFDGGDIHTFTVLWIYAEGEIEYYIKPFTFESYTNTVNWVAQMDPPGEDNNLTVSGMKILTDNITSFPVDFEDGTSHTFSVNWIYTNVEELTEYYIEPTEYCGSENTVKWTAYKDPPGEDNNIVARWDDDGQQPYILYDKEDNTTTFEVTFSDGTKHTFEDLEWEYDEPDETYNIDPKNYSSIDNVVNWTATKLVEGSETPITVSDTYHLNSEKDNVTTLTVDFDGDKHEFEVNWTYVAPTITYDITPISYSNQDNTINWTANKYSNGSIVDTQTGTVTLTEDILSFDVTFTGGDKQTFDVNWTYVAPTITYNISTESPTTDGDTISYVATRLVNGETVETINGTYSISKFEHVTHVDVEFTDGIHTFDVDWKQTSSGFVLTDETVVDITDPDGLMVMNTNSSTTTRLNNTTYTSAAISDVSLIKEIHITPDQTITTAPNYYGSHLCRSMTNLIVADVNLPKSITSVGTYFYANMFSSCSKLTTLPSGLNLPQGIFGSIGDYFCYAIFSGCSSLTTLPSDFNIPQGITGSVGTYFCAAMFSNCTSLTTLPTGFNLPPNITTVGVNFCYSLFNKCTSLTDLPTGFNLPQGITTATNSFCYSMFEQCSALTSLPINFKLPESLTSATGTYFCSSMFASCLALTALPAGFTIPQGITTMGANGCTFMFKGCTSLTTLPQSFNLPQSLITLGNYCFGNMFNGCTSLQGTGPNGDKNLYLPSSCTSSGNANWMFTDATILIEAGCPASPSFDNLREGYNIARS